MKLKTFGAFSFAFAMTMGLSSVQAQETASDCGVQPVMPEIPSEFESEAHAGEIVGEIKSYQGALKNYRDCLNLIVDSTDENVTVETKQEALDAFNQSVDNEGAVVNRYSAAVQKWNEDHPE